MLIGLIGKAGVGKSTAAKILCREHQLKPAAFADLMKHALIHFGLPQESLIGSQADKDAALNDWGGRSGREYMQALGMAMREQFSEFWIEAFYRRHGNRPSLVIEDVRMPNEADSIRRRGGLLIKIVRPSVTGTRHGNHASETSVDKIEGDILIVNDGQMEKFERHILTASNRWKSGKIIIDKKHYIDA